MARYLHPRLAEVYALCWAEEINRRRGREVVLHSSTAFYPVEQEGLNGMPLVPIPEDQIFGPEEAARKIRQWAPSGYLVDPGRVAQELELIPPEEIPILRDQWALLVMTDIVKSPYTIPWKGDYLCTGCLTPNFFRNVHCRKCLLPRPPHANRPSDWPLLRVKTRGDWVCPRCNDFVFGRNPFCRICQYPQIFAVESCFKLAAIKIEKGEVPSGKKKKKSNSKKRASNSSTNPTASTSAESGDHGSIPSTCFHRRRSSFASTCVDGPLQDGSPTARRMWNMAQILRQCQEEEELQCRRCRQGA